jgi:phenylalanyl-tRNA synthetase beta chain
MAIGFSGVRLFEIGNIFEGGTDAKENLALGLGLSGAWNNDWQLKQGSNLFVLKGIIEKLIQRFCGKESVASRCELEWAEPCECMQISVGGEVVAHAGRIKKGICSGSDLEHPAWFATALVGSILPSCGLKKEIRPPSQFPSVKRDISFTVDKSVSFSEIESLIKNQGKPLISKIELIDRYTGKQISREQHSLTFSIEYSSSSRTLTAQEVDSLHGSIAALLSGKFGAQLR